MSIKTKYIGKYGVLVVLVFFGSCSKFKRIFSDDAETILKNELRVEYLSKKKPAYILIENAAVKIEGEQSSRARMNFYLEKDKRLFVSIKMIGFEMARFQLTKDSVKYINRIKREYYFDDLKKAQEELGNIINFSSLQNLIATGFLSNDSKDFNNFFINSKISGESIEFSNEFGAGQNVLCNYSLDRLQLFDLAYLDYVKQLESKVFFERNNFGLNSMHGIFSYYGTQIKFNLEIDEIKNKEYSKTDFRIGRNYNEIDFLL